MKNIIAESPCCGKVLMANTDMVICTNGATATSTYTFVCPICDAVVVKPAPRRIVEFLTKEDVYECILTQENRPNNPQQLSAIEIRKFLHGLDDGSWRNRLTS